MLFYIHIFFLIYPFTILNKKSYVYNSSTIVLAKNPVFHDINKHIDTRFHYLCKDFVSRIFSQNHSNIMFFFQDERYVRSYKEIKFKGK
jgi:hypothetical protein